MFSYTKDTESKSLPPKRGSPSTAFTSIVFAPSFASTIDTSNVPPPKSNTMYLILKKKIKYPSLLFVYFYFTFLLYLPSLFLRSKKSSSPHKYCRAAAVGSTKS